MSRALDAFARLLRRHPPTLRRLAYLRRHHRLPNLRSPTTFTEKVNWRILNDRRELLRFTGDKLAMRAYAAEHGPSDLRLPQLYWSGTDLTDLESAHLPQRWVLKPNHSSGLVHFGHGLPDIEHLKALTRDWLRSDEWERLAEWSYLHAEPKLLAEEQLADPPPTDFKVFVFGGKAEFVQVDSNRFTDHRRRLYTRTWIPLPCRLKYPLAKPQPAPDELEQLLGTAEQLAAEFDFMRVDLYVVDCSIYFSELSPYPAGGMAPFRPRWYDAYLGALWQLPPELQPGQTTTADRPAEPDSQS